MQRRAYQVVVLPAAEDDLARLPPKERDRVAERIQRLSDDPRPRGAGKLQTVEGYRVRVGDYRVVYSIHDASRAVVVRRVRHRRDVYRRLN